MTSDLSVFKLTVVDFGITTTSHDGSHVTTLSIAIIHNPHIDEQAPPLHMSTQDYVVAIDEYIVGERGAES